MSADHILHLQCVLCGVTYDPGKIEYTCPACGPLGVLEVHYDYVRIAQRISRVTLMNDHDATFLRYRALLPFSYSRIESPALTIGGTPLYPVKRLRSSRNGKPLA